jgi:hypothetical protein
MTGEDEDHVHDESRGEWGPAGDVRAAPDEEAVVVATQSATCLRTSTRSP